MRDIKKRGELTWDTLAPWVISLGVLILALIIYGLLSGKGTGALDYFKQFWRFGK
jgi:hypothetical protein